MLRACYQSAGVDRPRLRGNVLWRTAPIVCTPMKQLPDDGHISQAANQLLDIK